MRHGGPHRHRTRAKGKRSVAYAIDWPGWSRGAKSAEFSLEKLESIRERYRPVAGLAGMAGELDAAGPWRSWRTGSELVRPTSGASPSRSLRPSRGRWAKPSALQQRTVPGLRCQSQPIWRLPLSGLIASRVTRIHNFFCRPNEAACCSGSNCFVKFPGSCSDTVILTKPKQFHGIKSFILQ
jgi:hypothetical protein